MGTRNHKKLVLKLIKFIAKLIIFVFGSMLLFQILTSIGYGIFALIVMYGNRGAEDVIDYSARAKVELNISDSFLVGISRYSVEKENDYGITCAGIYEIDFSDMSKAKLIYTDKEYLGYDRPFVKNDQLYCSAVKRSTLENTDSKEEPGYVILKVESGETKEVMRTHRRLGDFYPIDDHKIIYSYSDDGSREYDKEYNIEIYDQKTGKTNKIFNYRIPSTGREFLITTNPLTLIVESIHRQIIQVDEQGEQKILIEDGQFPSWYEEGKSILYQKTDGSVMLYDIDDNVSTFLGKMDILWEFKAMISPDKKFVAINEYAGIRGSERSSSLFKVVTIDGSAEMNAPLLKHILRGQVFWLKK